jgi:predicted dehydrogenase
MTGNARIGVIGLGEVGQHHVRGVLGARGADLAAIADLDAQLLAETAGTTGAAQYVDGVALLADESLDAVIICVPHKYHADLAVEALDRGKHVLVEKPMAVTTAECDRMIAAAEQAGRLLTVSHNQLFYEPHRKAKEMINRGAIGSPTMLRAHLAIGGKLGGWRADPDLTGGGLLFDAGVHRFYVARSLMGEIKAVTARLDTDRPRQKGEDQAAVTLEFVDGGLGVIDAGYHAPDGVFDDGIELIGADALIRIPGCEAHFENFSLEPDLLIHRSGTWEVVTTTPDSWPETIAKSVAHFIDCIAGRGDPLVPASEGRRIVEIIEAAYRSAIEGRTVSVLPA